MTEIVVGAVGEDFVEFRGGMVPYPATPSRVLTLHLPSVGDTVWHSPHAPTEGHRFARFQWPDGAVTPAEVVLFRSDDEGWLDVEVAEPTDTTP